MATQMSHTNQDIGKLLLRITVGGLMLFHGIHKLTHGHDFIISSLESKGLPGFLWMGVPVGEVLFPVFLILGLFTRTASVVIAFTMAMSIYLAFSGTAFQMNEFGAWNAELNIFYLFVSVAIFFLGAGKYSVYQTKY